MDKMYLFEITLNIKVKLSVCHLKLNADVSVWNPVDIE